MDLSELMELIDPTVGVPTLAGVLSFVLGWLALYAKTRFAQKQQMKRENAVINPTSYGADDPAVLLEPISGIPTTPAPDFGDRVSYFHDRILADHGYQFHAYTKGETKTGRIILVVVFRKPSALPGYQQLRGMVECEDGEPLVRAYLRILRRVWIILAARKTMV